MGYPKGRPRGPRPLGKTGGRVKGTIHIRTAIREAKHAEGGILPLEYMLKVLRDVNEEPERRDAMAIAAAPYVHPKLTSVEAKVEIRGHEAALALLK